MRPRAHIILRPFSIVRQSDIYPVAGSLQGKSVDCWPERHAGIGKRGAGQPDGGRRIHFLRGCRGRRSDPSWRHRGWQRQLSQSSLIACRHTWLKIIAWGGGGRPRPRNLPGRKDWGSSMRKRPAAEAPRIHLQVKAARPLYHVLGSLCPVSCAKARPREDRAALPDLFGTG